MTRRDRWRASYGAALLLVGISLLLDMWHALGRPGGRCPACRGRYGWRSHRCAWEDSPDAARAAYTADMEASP